MSEPTNDTQNWRDRTAEMVERYAPALHALSDTCDWNTGYADGYAQAVAQERARLRAAVEGLPSCECDWMDSGPDFACVCGEHNARPYRDDVVHLPDGQHARRWCAVLRLLDPEAEGGTP